MKLKVMKTDKRAKLPAKATIGSAGHDLYALLTESVNILPHRTVKIRTGIAIEIESRNLGGFIFARSGLATKHGVAPANCVGVIDSDYRGEIIVPLHNHTDEAYTIEPFERIAQMVIMPVEDCEVFEVESLSESSRGEDGFGSSGRK